ncbi:MAG: tetratricopeptide repeat protein [Blastocatellia bacterium]
MKTFTLVILLATCLSPIPALAQAARTDTAARQANFPSLLLEKNDRNACLTMLKEHKNWVTRFLWLVLINEGVRRGNAGNGNGALFAFQVAEDAAIQIGDNGLLAYALYREGYEHFAERDTKGALSLYLQSKKLFEETKSIRDETLVLSELGSLYILIGDYAEAESCSKESLALEESEGNNRPSVSGLPARYGFARAWSNLGEVSFWEGDYDAAVSRLQKARVFWETLGGQSNTYGAYLVNTLIDLGNAYRMTGNYTQALEQLNLALNTAKALGDKRRAAASLVSIGVLYLDQRDDPKSEEFLNQSLPLFSELKDIREIASAEINKGVLMQRLNKPGEATAAFQRALEQAGRVPAPDLTVAAEEGLGVVY